MTTTAKKKKKKKKKRMPAFMTKLGGLVMAKGIRAWMSTLDYRAVYYDQSIDPIHGGNQQRINIAIGLLARPKVLLLDEPSVGLDPRQRARLWEFIGGLADDGTTVIFSTHDIQEAERYGNRLLVLADGEALFDGPAEGLREAVRREAPEAADRDFETAFVAYLHHRGH